jgi:hypothetical protein
MELQSIKAFFRENPGMVLTSAYIYASIVGVISEVVRLGAFGVPAFYFTSSTDLLFSALRDWLSLIFGVLPFLFILVGDTIIRVVGEEQTIFAKRYLLAATFFLTIVLVPSFVVFHSLLSAQDIKSKEKSGADMLVIYEGPRTSTYAVTQTKQLRLIDANGSFLFFWNAAEKSVLILPIGKLVSVSPIS